MFCEGLLRFFFILITNTARDTVNLLFNYSNGMFIVTTFVQTMLFFCFLLKEMNRKIFSNL